MTTTPATASNSPVDAQGLREFAGHFATGVSVITATDSTGRPRGITVNAISSLSMEPPLYLVCLDNASNTLAAIRSSGAFGVNLLHEHQSAVSNRFAGKSPDKFHDIDYQLASSGVPLLTDCLANAVCQVVDIMPGGDHYIVLGSPEAYDVRGGRPLLYFQGRYMEHPA